MPQFESALLHLASWTLAASLKGTIVICAALVLRRTLGRWLLPQLRRALWIPVLLCLVSPFGPRLSMDVFAPTSYVAAALGINGRTSPHNVSSDPRRVPAIERIGGPVLSAATSTAFHQQSLFSVRSGLLWLSLIWAGVFGSLWALYLRNFIRYRRIRQSARRVIPEAASIFVRCKEELGLRRKVQLLEASSVESPVVFGWWSPTLLLPLGLADELSAGQLRHVFLHELVHVQRFDVLFNWLAAFAQTLHWFNPVVWYAMRLLRSDTEYACDADALAVLSQTERGDYGLTLIQLADSRAVPVLPAYGLGIVKHSQLKERITMITRYRPASFKLIFMVGVVFVGLTSAALTQPQLADASQATQPQSPSSDRNSIVATQPVTTPSQQRVALASVESDKEPVAASPVVSRDHDGAGRSKGVPMQVLIEQVSANTGRRLVADPSAVVATVILYGQKLNQIDYSDFLTILRVNGFTAIDVNGYINVVPVSAARTLPIPTMIDGKVLPDDQFASLSLGLKNACAGQLIPILRPQMPPYAYVVADIGSNSILAIDTFANLKRMRAVIDDLDARSTLKGQCH